MNADVSNFASETEFNDCNCVIGVDKLKSKCCALLNLLISISDPQIPIHESPFSVLITLTRRPDQQPSEIRLPVQKWNILEVDVFGDDAQTGERVTSSALR